MRIGMFTDSWLPTRDGCVTSITKYREALTGLGHEVYIFAPGDKTGIDPEDDCVFRFKARTFSQYPDYSMALYPSKWKNDLIVENDIDILHNHGIAFMALKAMIGARLTQRACLLNFHTWVTEAPHYYPVNIDKDLMIRLSWIYLRSLIWRSDGVIAPSQAALDELGQKVRMRHTDVVAPGVDGRAFNEKVDGSAVRERFGLVDTPLLVHVGRVSLEKNLELVLEALPHMKKVKQDIKLMVVGKGPAKEHYEMLAREMGLEDDVIFTGFVPDDELPEYYAAGDAFVIASPFETLGIVIIEALATGTPVAGLNHRVIPEVIRHGVNGFLFEHDPKDCARQALAAMDAGDDVRKNAIETARKYDNIEAGKKLLDVYKVAIDIKQNRLEDGKLFY